MSSRLHHEEIISYDHTDTRYKQNIKYLDRFTKNIYPLHFRERCDCIKSCCPSMNVDYDGDIDEIEFDGGSILESKCNKCKNKCKVMDGEYDPYDGGDYKYEKNECNSCFAQGYEHCSDVSTNGGCGLDMYGRIESTIKFPYLDVESGVMFNDEEVRDLKNRKSTAYDRTRIHKSDGVLIDNSVESEDVYEGFGGIGNVVKPVTGVAGGAVNTAGGVAGGVTGQAVNIATNPIGAVTGGLEDVAGVATGVVLAPIKGIAEGLGLPELGDKIWIFSIVCCVILILLASSAAMLYLSQLNR